MTTILVVDDNADNRYLLLQMLKLNGYEVVSAVNGRDALDVAQEKRPDLVLMDVRLLGERGWRLMGDEFALLDPESGALHPFPRAVSLKNGAIRVMEGEVDAARFGPRLEGTPKGAIRHLRPNGEALARMDEPASPALILFPRFGEAAAARAVGPAEIFMRLTQASTNYVALGQAGFDALTRLVATPAAAIDYPDTARAVDLVETLWAEAA